MINLLVAISALVFSIYSIKKKSYITTCLSIFIIGFVLSFSFSIHRQSINYYKESAHNYDFTRATLINKSQGLTFDNMKLENGVDFNDKSFFNKFAVVQQYHSKDIEVHMYEIKYELEKKLLYYFTGIPLSKKGYFLELGIPQNV